MSLDNKVDPAETAEQQETPAPQAESADTQAVSPATLLQDTHDTTDALTQRHPFIQKMAEALAKCKIQQDEILQKCQQLSLYPEEFDYLEQRTQNCHSFNIPEVLNIFLKIQTLINTNPQLKDLYIKSKESIGSYPSSILKTLQAQLEIDELVKIHPRCKKFIERRTQENTSPDSITYNLDSLKAIITTEQLASTDPELKSVADKLMTADMNSYYILSIIIDLRRINDLASSNPSLKAYADELKRKKLNLDYVWNELNDLQTVLELIKTNPEVQGTITRLQQSNMPASYMLEEIKIQLSIGNDMNQLNRYEDKTAYNNFKKFKEELEKVDLPFPTNYAISGRSLPSETQQEENEEVFPITAKV